MPIDTADEVERAAITAGAGALRDLLTMLAIDPDATPEDFAGPTIAEALASAAIDAAARVYTEAQEVETERMVNECGLQGFNLDPTTRLGVRLGYELATSYVQAAEGMLGARNAKNYVETRVWNKETGKPYVITFARAEGQTAHELRRAAEEQLACATADAELYRKLLAAVTGHAEPVICEKGCVFADGPELEQAWNDMVIAAHKANGEPVPDIVGRTAAHDIFQCPRCHAMIPAHER